MVTLLFSGLIELTGSISSALTIAVLTFGLHITDFGDVTKDFQTVLDTVLLNQSLSAMTGFFAAR